MSEFPSHARVVVIGGGVIGTSILYHLAKKGWKDCVLLERRELSCGSSWHAAGQFHIINSNANLSALQLHTLKFYPQLQEESEQDIGLHRTGGIYLASTQERLNYLIQERAKNRRTNPEMEFIDLAEAKRMHPLIDEKHFLGCLYDPLDGYIDPASVVQAYAKAARKAGATILQQTMVQTLTPTRSGGWLVGCEQGEINADIVVNAGGLWAREVGHMAGIELPLMAMEHHYLITEALPEIEALQEELPSMVDFDGNAYGRQEGMGMLLGTYEQGGSAWAVDSTPWDFGHELLPNQLERIADRLDMAFQHFPRLGTAGIKKVVNGPFTFAPDGNALVGPVPGLKNYWAACAVMAGYCQGAGIGDVFSDWMMNGEPGMDVFAMDVARFGSFATPQYTLHKVIENFGRRFQISYPNEELPAMRPWRTTALYEPLKARGAVFGAAFGLEHALWFAESAEAAIETPTFRRSNAHPYVAAEVRNVRENVGFIEVANFAKYTVSGSDAEAFLDTVFASTLPATGKMRLSPMLSAGGKLLGDLSLAKLADNRYFIVGSASAQQAHTRHFAQYAEAYSDLHINNQSQQLHGIAIAGKNATALFNALTANNTRPMRFMEVREMTVAGVPATVARVSFTGDCGYEIYCTAEYQLALYQALNAAGAQFGLHPFGARALMAMRLEKNYGAWALDYREDFTPLESGLHQFVNADKATAFVGKAAVLAEQKIGAPRKMVVLAICGNDADCVGDEPIFKGAEIVGFVTSGGYGHTVEKSLAIAYIDSTALTTGGDYAVEILGEQYPAALQTQAAYDPAGTKMRA